ncbi:purine-cytosine permease family protein [Microbacterium esteraromaticum]|uniref:purine-cytosine permease family protein n=1 Tax=Microbacterium esteraromaticum TaxID=57043 RepID=UPI00195AA51B|nr:cytosine permease [Microbacterium esteraromaticum]MBM7465796.1 purine-cytosine permease-like protein [Microbacterium esteraromaticum]
MSLNPASDAAADAASATHPETRGIELIGDAERHGRPRDLFFVWAAPNVSVLNFTVGATLIVLGLELWQALLVIIAGALPWIFTGVIAISGPAAGTSGSVIMRAMYGVIGNRIVVAFMGWLVSAVYLALNWLAAAFLGADMLARLGWDAPIAAPIVVTIVVAAVTVLVAVYGHGLILRTYTYVAVLLLAIFLVLTGFILPNVDWAYRAAEPLQGGALWSAASIGFAILASSPLSYINSPDMARYLPRSTPPGRIIAATALGGAVPGVFFTTMGALMATAVSAEDLQFGVEGVMLGMLPAALAPLLVFGVILNTVALNGMTTYTSSMALQAIGVPLRRIPAAIVVGVIGTALTIYLTLSTTFLSAVNLILQFLIVVAAPVMAIFVVDVVLRRNRYDGLDLFDDRPGGRYWYSGGWGVPGIVAFVVGIIASALCLSTDVWTGPIAEALGYIDLSVPVGVIVAGGLYAVMSGKVAR